MSVRRWQKNSFKSRRQNSRELGERTQPPGAGGEAGVDLAQFEEATPGSVVSATKGGLLRALSCLRRGSRAWSRLPGSQTSWTECNLDSL